MSKEVEYGQIVITRLEEDIKNLQSRKDGLDTQIQASQKRSEDGLNLEKSDLQKERNQLRKDFQQMKNELVAEQDSVERQLQQLNDREQSVVKREEQVKDANFWLEKLQKERYEIYELRARAKEIMDEAKTREAEVNEGLKNIDEQKGFLDNREIGIKKTELEWHDEMGKLTQESKDLKLWHSDLDAREKMLSKPKQEVISG
ncbi:hypothetical protein LCGC14_2161650 [marine sediment metagenome]|uniref:Uncharacterized protein n=1 Tax=marine sediment metagenome TaxID=412755 RepID=A0A0F9DSJ3_9ZZZZ